MNEISIASIIGASVFGGVLGVGLCINSDGGAGKFVGAPQRPLILGTRSATEGAPAYDFYCASCHGRAGQGGRRGPPLVHQLYDIGERTDAMYLAAMNRGAPQKHWKFGPMPPVEDISPRHAAAVVGFVAELQAYNTR